MSWSICTFQSDHDHHHQQPAANLPYWGRISDSSWHTTECACTCIPV